jgi:iron complex transport system ATP-binding protein
MKYQVNQQKLIEYKNITVSRNNRAVLNGINLTINLGEHTAILGPNGAGKSFLIKTITREYYPHYDALNSYLRILGKDNWNIFELRNQLGIVSSDLANTHTRNFTGYQAILSGFFSSVGIWVYDEVTPPMEQKAWEVMEKLEISHLTERKMNELSTGEIRRILIGRALVHNPKALLLDEPSASLDFRAAHDLRELLRKIANGGTSVIVVTHNLTDIIPEINRVILIKDGNIYKDGLKRKVLTSKSLNQLFDIPLKIAVEKGYYHIS